MAAPASSTIDNLFGYGVHPQAKTLLVVGEIDEAMVKSVMSGLAILDGNANDKITVRLCSYGGDIYSGLAIYDSLRACHSEVSILGYGAVMSMAAVILQAGDERILMPNTTVMLHIGRTSADEDSIDKVKSDIKEAERIDRRCTQILCEVMGITFKQFMARYRKDSYFDADQSVKLGLASKVVKTY